MGGGDEREGGGEEEQGKVEGQERNYGEEPWGKWEWGFGGGESENGEEGFEEEENDSGGNRLPDEEP